MKRANGIKWAHNYIRCAGRENTCTGSLECKVLALEGRGKEAAKETKEKKVKRSLLMHPNCFAAASVLSC